jgi:hypothetical protein
MLLSFAKKRIELNRQRKIAAQVRKGIVPKDVSKEDVWAALEATRPKNATEMFGFVSAVKTPRDGGEPYDYGLVSVQEVTSAFAKKLVDAMVGSGDIVNDFNQHKMGAGSTAETDTDTALADAQAGAQAATGGAAQTHGSGSNIYQSVGTLTAGSAYGCREHGVFNASTLGVLLDRSVVTNIDLNTDDVVTWTYELTVNGGG